MMFGEPPVPRAAQPPRGAGLSVQGVLQDLTGLEGWHVRRSDVYLCAGTRVTTFSRRTLLDLKGAKTSELQPLFTLENSRDDSVAIKERFNGSCGSAFLRSARSATASISSALFTTPPQCGLGCDLDERPERSLEGGGLSPGPEYERAPRNRKPLAHRVSLHYGLAGPRIRSSALVWSNS